MAFLVDRFPVPCTFLTASRPPRRVDRSCVRVAPPESGRSLLTVAPTALFKNLGSALYHLALPPSHLRGVHLVFRSNLLYRLEALHRIQGHSSLEFCTVDSSLVFHVSFWGFPP
jgi:hypothetical protein